MDAFQSRTCLLIAHWSPIFPMVMHEVCIGSRSSVIPFLTSSAHFTANGFVNGIGFGAFDLLKVSQRRDISIDPFLALPFQPWKVACSDNASDFDTMKKQEEGRAFSLRTRMLISQAWYHSNERDRVKLLFLWQIEYGFALTRPTRNKSSQDAYYKKEGGKIMQYRKDKTWRGNFSCA